MKAYRESKRQGGSVHLGCYLPAEHRELLRQFCEEQHLSLGGAICYLLDLHYPERPDPDDEDRTNRHGPTPSRPMRDSVLAH